MPENKKKEKSKTTEKIDIKKYLVIFNIIELLLIFIIISLFYLTIPLTSTKVINIPKGSTKNVINYLKKAGYDLNYIDLIVVRLIGLPQSGWIDLKKENMTKLDFLYKLTTSKAAIKRITLVPGETYYFFLKNLESELHLNFDELIKSYNKYSYSEDGNILAESYDLPLGMDEDHLIFYLINYSDKKYNEFSKKIFGLYNKKQWYNYLTIASIIQKESADTEEMPLVSSVIYNRIKKNMKLQMDGTLNYGIYSHEAITSARIKDDDSHYNTYKNSAIPNSPVCAVSLNSIKAAIFPAKTEYLYFVKSQKDGRHIFSEDFKTHRENIEKNRIFRKAKKIYLSKKIIKEESKEESVVNKSKNKIETKEKPVFKENDKKSLKSLWKNVN